MNNHFVSDHKKMSKASSSHRASNRCGSFDFSNSMPSFGSVHPNYFGRNHNASTRSFQSTMISTTPTIRKISMKWGTFIDYISVRYISSINIHTMRTLKITFSDNSQKSFGSSTGGYDSAEVSLLSGCGNDDEYIVKVS